MTRPATKTDPLHILVDAREQAPWTFGDGFVATRATLTTGDYTVAGLEDRFAIERKSLGDFVGTVIHNWIRFRKELNRLGGMDLAAVVVEADVADAVEKRYDSDAAPEAVLGRAAEITIDHGIPVFWWGRRAVCEPRVWQFVRLAAKRLGADR